MTEEARAALRARAVEQGAKDRSDQIAARVKFHHQALSNGVPASLAPSARSIKTMSDSDWNAFVSRAGRLGFHGLDDNGAPLPAPSQAPLIPAPRLAAAVSPLNQLNGIDRSVPANPSTPQGRLSSVLGITPPPAPAAIAGQPLRSVVESPMSAGERAATDAKYAPRDANGNLAPVAGSVRSASDIPAGTIRSINGVRLPDEHPGVLPAGAAAPVRTQPAGVVAPVAATPKPGLDALANAGTVPLGGSFDPSLAAATPGFDLPPSSAYKFGAAVRNIAVGEPVVPGSDIASRSKAGGPVSASVRAPLSPEVEAAQRGVGPTIGDYVKDAFQGLTGGGKATAAGVSNSQAAGFEQPTAANPKPVTPTTPDGDIDKSKNAISRFGQTEEELKKNKEAFAGF